MEANTPTDSKLQNLESELEDLKLAYELYFSGQARIEPKERHESWKRRLLTLNPAELNSTSQKFRFVNLKSRYNQLQVHWSKICQQIETGHYKRDQFILKIHEKEKEMEQKASTAPVASKVKMESFGISPKEKKAIDALYEKMKQSSGANAKMPERDSFAKKMEKQIIHFKEKNPGKNLEFRLAKDETGKLKIKISGKEKAS